MAAMMAMPQVKEMKKLPRFIFLFKGKRITCRKTDTSGSTMATDVSKREVQETHPELDPVKKKQRVVPNPNSRVHQSSSSISLTTTNYIPKRKIQETHPDLDLDLDPVVVKKKRRQIMVVPSPNSRVQSSHSKSQLPNSQTQINPSTTHHHSTPNFQVSNTITHQSSQQATNATEIYESKLKNSQRKLHQGYEALDRAKKQRQIVVIGGKPNSTHKKSIPKGSRFKTKKLQRLYDNHKTRPFF